MTIEVMNFERTKKSLLDCFDKDSFNFSDKDDIQSIEFLAVQDTILGNISFDLLKYESSLFFKGQEYIIKKCVPHALGDVVAKEIVAIHIMFTIQDGYQYDTISGVKSINECLTHVFKADKNGFKYVVDNINGAISRVEQENFGDANLLKLIEEIMEDYDVALIRDNKTITFIPNQYFKKKTNNQIRYLYNTDDVSFEIDTYDFKTQIMGFGKRQDAKEGQEVGDWYFEPVVYTSPKASEWGVRIQESVRDERYTIRSNMIQRLKRDLRDYPRVVGKVSMKELNFDVHRGDLIRFIYEPLNIDTYIKVVGITDNPYSNEPPQIDLDSNKRTMLDYMLMLMRGGIG
ncbi:phage tail protein [Vagococcus fluvialis]|uniref:phage tail protein n=1 Tax=Vagococcus fluvialis TaxID=2738 RepID=UPI001D0B3B32|nr:phage tail protein [Vagococcus fluvialis]UDM70134.1 phage tail protein [Vagococcus fluvialis]UDM77554.1 phage tail protein [Vagococcus fluvialis]UDM81822.1 phage tail protein [Vagococcus fluvialis]WNF91361.1 phage tail protein [Vagococcus fluvialis]